MRITEVCPSRGAEWFPDDERYVAFTDWPLPNRHPE